MHNLPEVMVKLSPHCQGRAWHADIQYAVADKAVACRQRLRGIDTHTWHQRCHRQDIVLWQRGDADCQRTSHHVDTGAADRASEGNACRTAGKSRGDVVCPARYHVRGMAINIVTKDYAGTNQLSGQIIGGMRQNKYANEFGNLYLSLQRGKFGLDAQYKYVNGNSVR